MLEHCNFSLDQWEIKVHLLWGKCFNIPLWPFDQCDTATHWWPFWMQVKSRYGLVKLTYFGDNCCCICEDGDKTKMGLTDNTLGIQSLARFKLKENWEFSLWQLSKKNSVVTGWRSSWPGGCPRSREAGEARQQDGGAALAPAALAPAALALAALAPVALAPDALAIVLWLKLVNQELLFHTTENWPSRKSSSKWRKTLFSEKRRHSSPHWGRSPSSS